MKKPRILASALGLLLTCASARAELLAYEPFATGGSDYTPGNVVGQDPASFGFSGAWARTQPGQSATFEVVSQPLGVTNNPGLGGAARFIATQTPGVLPEDPPTDTFPNFTRLLSAPLTQSVVYYSLLFRQDDASASQRSEFRLVGPDGDVRIGTNTNAISLGSTLPDAVTPGAVDSAQVGTAQQWVVKIDSAGGTATFWKNPGYGLGTDPLTPTQTLSFTPGAYSFTSIHVTCFVNGAGTRTATYDEFMIGENIADVTATQAPPAGDVIAYEPFATGGTNYVAATPPPTSIVGQGPATFGFINAWKQNNTLSTATVDATPLTYAGKSFGNGSVTVSTTGATTNPVSFFSRPLAYTPTSNVFYASLLYKVTANTNGRSEFRLYTGDTTGDFLSIGSNFLNLRFETNIGAGNQNATLNPSPAPISLNTVQQWVVKVDNTTPDTPSVLTFFVNPGYDLTTDPTLTPTNSLQITLNNNDKFSPNFMILKNGLQSAVTGTRTSTFDALRLGKTINSVTSSVVFPLTDLPLISIKPRDPSGANLTLSGSPGAEINIDYSTTLDIGSWLPLGTTVTIPGGGSIVVEDPATDPKRFYRASVAP